MHTESWSSSQAWCIFPGQHVLVPPTELVQIPPSLQRLTLGQRKMQPEEASWGWKSPLETWWKLCSHCCVTVQEILEDWAACAKNSVHRVGSMYLISSLYSYDHSSGYVASVGLHLQVGLGRHTLSETLLASMDNIEWFAVTWDCFSVHNSKKWSYTICQYSVLKQPPADLCLLGIELSYLCMLASKKLFPMLIAFLLQPESFVYLRVPFLFHAS